MRINLTKASVFAKKKLRKRAIIIGDGSTGKNLLNFLRQHKQYGYDVVKYINGAVIAKANGRAAKKINSIAIGNGAIGYIDEVFVAQSDRNSYNLHEIISLLRKYAVRLRVVGKQEMTGQSFQSMTMLGEFPLLSVRNEPLENPDNLFVKRWFDVAFSVTVLLLICSWLFPLIAILVKINSRGPVFFKQERWGKRNRRFTCLKFRSMSLASCMEDQNGNFRQVSKGDKRVTAVGRLLRRTNLDELPQFINVLAGDMSVVGPRPHASIMNLESLHTIDAYLVRHQAKPGITGWAQVNGFRGESRDVDQLRARVKYDVWYIEHWSFLLDLKIIALTVVKMFTGDKKAY
ncbi:exopolysaccharide biosynthesis polyprenyl glycosylphosphotransferase [Olivibacter sp. SDN3]|nr:exopolysaccharide biosynthesis polyprenyl glycosylphosphotransferase [Olivibacter sp. SDN3]